jgi:rhamnosyltransferase
MRRDEVLAVVVSYNGLQKTRQGVNAVREQVGHVHIVDNGSEAESLAILDVLERDSHTTVQRLSENKGVGHALNLGVKRARELGYSWLLTMDQDSVVDRSMMEAYEAAIERHAERVCLAPTLATHGKETEPEDILIGYAITSGNLVRVSVFDTIGLYDEGFFIDSIDFDFSLRLRKAGYSVFRVSDALMQHRVGEPVDVPHFLRRFYAQHPAVRRYYMCRNFLYMAERYFVRFPKFIAKLALVHMIHVVLVGIFDPTPLKSYRAMARGMGDYFARKVGPYVERTR